MGYTDYAIQIVDGTATDLHVSVTRGQRACSLHLTKCDCRLDHYEVNLDGRVFRTADSRSQAIAVTVRALFQAEYNDRVDVCTVQREAMPPPSRRAVHWRNLGDEEGTL